MPARRVALALTPHPSASPEEPKSIRAVCARSDDHDLTLQYEASGDTNGLLIPVARAAARAHGLWHHTCFEAFLAGEGHAGYLELNFSPSGEWAIYRFRDYRDGMLAIEPESPPRIVVERSRERLAVSVDISLRSIEVPDEQPLRVGLAAVIESRSGTLSYWALRHPAGEPNFHHPDSFALTLR